VTAPSADPGVDIDVRFMPDPPTGGRPALSALALADFGALAGAMGLERGEMAELVSKIQTTAAKTTLEVLPDLLALVKRANQARINRLIQAVRALQAVPLPATGLRAVLGVQPIQTQPMASLVSRDAVIALLSQALVENPAV
jgi:hypothetical protein